MEALNSTPLLKLHLWKKSYPAAIHQSCKTLYQPRTRRSRQAVSWPKFGCPLRKIWHQASENTYNRISGKDY